MSSTPPLMEKKSENLAVESISRFIQKHRIVLGTMLAALLVFIIGYFVWMEIAKRSREASTLLAEEAQQLYQDWHETKEETRKKELEDKLEAGLDTLLNKYPGQYGALRAQLLRVEMSFEKNDFEKAAEDSMLIVQRFPKGYPAALSLFNAAVAYESLDKIDSALEAYKRLIEQYKDTYLIPHALFSLGRLQERKEDFNAASEAYNRLEDEYPFSNWTKVARNRIIDLKIKGKIKA